MTREEVFDADRKEQDYYFHAKAFDPIKLPVTRLGFEGLLAAAAKLCVLPIDDDARKLLCGFIHSLDRKTDTTTLETVASALHKSFANQLTWTLDQEIDARIRAKAKALEEAATTPKPELTVVASENTDQANH